MNDTQYLGKKKGIVFVPGIMLEAREKKSKTIVLKALRRHARRFFLLHADGPQTAFLSLRADGMYTSL